MLWSPAYLAAPTKGTSRARVAGILRDVKSRIRVTMEQEHEWGPHTTEDTGKHRAGRVRVAAIGDLAARNALVNVPEGALFILQDGLDHTLQIYDGGWVSIGEIRHGELDNLGALSAHPQYTPADDIDDNTWEFEMDDHTLSVPATGDPTAKGMVLANHFDEAIPHSGYSNLTMYSDPFPIDTVLSLEEVDITVPSVDNGSSGYGYTIAHTAWIPGLWLLPNIYRTAGSNDVVLSCRYHTVGANGDDYGFQLGSPTAFSVRVRGYRARIAEN